MNWINSILYGFVSGITEFLPLSSQAHQAIFMKLFGVGSRQPVLDLMIHLAVLLSVFVSCKPLVHRFLREQQIVGNSRRRNIYESKGYHELRLIKTAAVPLVLGLITYIATKQFESNELFLALFLLINGIVLLIPDYVRKGNKDARMLSGFDGVLLGLSGALSAIPGFSRIGMMRSLASVRGASDQYIINWIILLSIPALALITVLDLVSMFAFGLGIVTFGMFLGYLLAAAAAFLGGYLGLSFLHIILSNNLFSGFAYYSIGASVFVFVLYLIT